MWSPIQQTGESMDIYINCCYSPPNGENGVAVTLSGLVMDFIVY
jgi:hypothetical protein